MKRFFLLLSLFSITLFGCKVSVDEPVQTPTPEQVSEITFDKTELNLTEQQETNITVIAKNNRKLNNITWSITPPKQDIVKLTLTKNNNSATIKGLKKGNVTIKATEEGTGKNATIKINVKPVTNPTLSIKILNNETSLIPGNTTTFEVISSDKKPVGNLTFSYGTAGIVDVKKTGNNYTITALKNGTTSIKVTEAKTNRTASIDNFTVADAYINVTDESGKNISELTFNQKESKTLSYKIESKLETKSIGNVTFEINPNYNKYFSIVVNPSNNTLSISQKETKDTSIPSFELRLKAVLTDSYTIYSQKIILQGTAYTPSYSNISIKANKNSIEQDEELILTVSTTDNRNLNTISWKLSDSNYVDIVENSNNGTLKIKGKNAGTVTITATEANTGKNSSLSIEVKAKTNPEPSPYTLQIGEKGNTSNLIPKNIELTEDIFIDIRAFDDYGTNQSISYVTVKGLPEDVDPTFITTDKQSFSYYATIHAKRLDVGREVKVYFVAGIGRDEVSSDFYTIKRIEKESKPEEKPSPETKPDSGSGEIVGPSIKNPVYDIISPNTVPDLNLQKKETKIIDHNYETEKVYWLGGIDAPKPEDFKDYESTGQIEYEYDEVGNKIENSGVASDKRVPKYYVLDKEKTNPTGKNWYNVNKSMSTEAPDSSMCWAMASAGALHWWFDSLGKDYTDKLFYIRKNRQDMTSPTTNLIFDQFHADDIHYKPLSTEGKVEDIVGRSGIASYAIKSFDNIGGNPRDLFRLYFLSENDNKTLFGNNYKKGRSLGLLNGMDWIATSGVNRKDGNDEKLWEYVSLVDHSRNTIVNEFKRAINEKCAIVLEQGNIRDDATSADSSTMKSAHAIIVWGVIFDESEQNLVGLYVGDNNLKDGNLARVDLVYKQVSNNGGRYYYAAPYIDQTSDKYLKSTSIYAIDKLYPPTDTIKNWIDSEAKKLNYPSQKK